MTHSQMLRTVAVGLAAAAILAQAALARGEAKNERPFTRTVDARTMHASSHVDPQIQGEPKNVLPFTRPATIVVTEGAGGGFDWTDGAIGGAAGIGIAAAGAGLVLVMRRSPRTA